jgi:lipopolysaccharide/colanic/teichoic acid biosynthesis glycosyltransferase
MRGRRYNLLKRLIDVVGASLGLILTAPIQGVIALLVRYKLGSPVLFRQQRPGRGEEIFELTKFRTMREPDVAAGLVSDDQRLTRFGQLLRSSSLDELPTLWNVLRGDMSLVGPRPLLVSYLDRYTPEQRRRHEVRPGVTGLAQVSGRNSLSWQEKFAKDVEYVDTRSHIRDLWILWKTVKTTVARGGVSAEDHATMPEFVGNEYGGASAIACKCGEVSPYDGASQCRTEGVSG